MANLPAVAHAPVIKSTKSGALHRDIIQVAERDYLFMLRGIAVQEIGVQEKMGNKPTGMVIDGRTGKGIDEATRSVVVWFADRKQLGDAIVAARFALVERGRLATGRTIGEAKYFYRTGRNGALNMTADPRGIAMNIANPAALDLYVAIPVAHIRKWQWLGKMGERNLRRTRNKRLLKYARARGYQAAEVSASVFEFAAKDVQRLYRALDVDDVYLDVPNLNPRGRTSVDRMPAIKVSMKVRGRGK